MTIDCAVKQFEVLSSNGQRHEIVRLLRELLKSDFILKDLERCWVYWNISDNLAMLRESDEEFKNHKLFENQLLIMDSKFLHWIVSDATQKMSLLIGGYENYWIELYDYACKTSPKTEENAVIRFETHRATVMVPTVIDYAFDKNHSLFALENLKQSVLELSNSSNMKYYEMTYYTQAIAAHMLTRDSYAQFLEKSQICFESLLLCLKEEASYDDEKKHLLGSWEHLNSLRSNYNQATCGINNYIIQLVNSGEYRLALSCYEKIEPYKWDYGQYFKSKIQLAQSMM